MRYPCLVPRNMCKTDICVEIEQEGLTKYGEPLPTINVTCKCNYQDKAHTVLTAQKKLIQLSGCALIPGDIAPELPTISGGKIIVNGVERWIFKGEKARNPDGTVNFTRLEVE